MTERVIRLVLDPSGVEEGAKRALDFLRQLQQAAATAAQITARFDPSGIEAGVARGEEALKSLKTADVGDLTVSLDASGVQAGATEAEGAIDDLKASVPSDLEVGLDLDALRQESAAGITALDTLAAAVPDDLSVALDVAPLKSSATDAEDSLGAIAGAVPDDLAVELDTQDVGTGVESAIADLHLLDAAVPDDLAVELDISGIEHGATSAEHALSGIDDAVPEGLSLALDVAPLQTAAQAAEETLGGIKSAVPADLSVDLDSAGIADSVDAAIAALARLEAAAPDNLEVGLDVSGLEASAAAGGEAVASIAEFVPQDLEVELSTEALEQSVATAADALAGLTAPEDLSVSLDVTGVTDGVSFAVDALGQLSQAAPGELYASLDVDAVEQGVSDAEAALSGLSSPPALTASLDVSGVESGAATAQDVLDALQSPEPIAITADISQFDASLDDATSALDTLDMRDLELAVKLDAGEVQRGIDDVNASIAALFTGPAPKVSVEFDGSAVEDGLTDVQAALGTLAAPAPVVLTADDEQLGATIEEATAELQSLADTGNIELDVTLDASEVEIGVATATSALAALASETPPEVSITFDASDVEDGLEGVHAALGALESPPALPIEVDAADALSTIDETATALDALTGQPATVTLEADASGIEDASAALDGLADAAAEPIQVNLDTSTVRDGVDASAQAIATITAALSEVDAAFEEAFARGPNAVLSEFRDGFAQGVIDALAEIEENAHLGIEVDTSALRTAVDVAKAQIAEISAPQSLAITLDVQGILVGAKAGEQAIDDLSATADASLANFDLDLDPSGIVAGAETAAGALESIGAAADQTNDSLEIDLDTSQLEGGAAAATESLATFAATAEELSAAINGVGPAAEDAADGIEALRASAEESAREIEKLRGRLKELEDRSHGAASSTGGLVSQFKSLKAGAAAVVAALAVHEIIEYADAWEKTSDILRLVTSSEADLVAVQSRLKDVAGSTRSDLEATVKLYASLARANDSLGLTQNELIGVTKTISQTFQLSGASAQEAAAGANMLALGLERGELQGRALIPLFKEFPSLAQTIADGMGKTVDQIKLLGEQGKLSAEVILKALKDQAPQVEEAFSHVVPEIGEAFKTLETSITAFVGRLSTASGAGAGFAAIIDDVSGAVDDLADAFTGALGPTEDMAPGLKLFATAALITTQVVKSLVQTLTADLGFAFRTAGDAIGISAARVVALAHGNFTEFNAIGKEFRDSVAKDFTKTFTDLDDSVTTGNIDTVEKLFKIWDEGTRATADAAGVNLDAIPVKVDALNKDLIKSTTSTLDQLKKQQKDLLDQLADQSAAYKLTTADSGGLLASLAAQVDSYGLATKTAREYDDVLKEFEIKRLAKEALDAAAKLKGLGEELDTAKLDAFQGAALAAADSVRRMANEADAIDEAKSRLIDFLKGSRDTSEALKDQREALALAAQKGIEYADALKLIEVGNITEGALRAADALQKLGIEVDVETLKKLGADAITATEGLEQLQKQLKATAVAKELSKDLKELHEDLLLQKEAFAIAKESGREYGDVLEELKLKLKFENTDAAALKDVLNLNKEVQGLQHDLKNAEDISKDFFKHMRENSQDLLADFFSEHDLDDVRARFGKLLLDLSAQALSAKIFQLLGSLGSGSTTGGGGGGIFAQLIGKFFGQVPKAANGLDFTVAGSGGTDSQLVTFLGSPGEHVSVQTPTQRAAAGNRLGDFRPVFVLPPNYRNEPSGPTHSQLASTTLAAAQRAMRRNS